MKRAIQPWVFLLVTLSGWVNRHQQKVVDYLVEENRVLKGKLRGKRIRLTDDERRRLAVKGKALGRKLLGEVASIVTPETIMGWHRKLIAKKWDYSSKKGLGGRVSWLRFLSLWSGWLARIPGGGTPESEAHWPI